MDSVHTLCLVLWLAVIRKPPACAVGIMTPACGREGSSLTDVTVRQQQEAPPTLGATDPRPLARSAHTGGQKVILCSAAVIRQGFTKKDRLLPFQGRADRRTSLFPLWYSRRIDGTPQRLKLLPGQVVNHRMIGAHDSRFVPPYQSLVISCL